MKSYEAFKASREKIDPSSRKMNEHQWQQAYAAYKSTRERVHSHSKDGGSKGSRKREASSMTSGMHTPSRMTPTAQLRHKVRAMSGYEEVRMLINLLVWIAMGVIFARLVAECFFYMSTEACVIAVGSAALRLVGVFFFKTLAHIVVDIPDIALYRMHTEGGDREANVLYDSDTEDNC